ncbi:MAG: hypothetical protein OXF93_24265 [Acidobacteria bacterium]|nr:hypothetical protein [Acidobacteriota bacterium]
MPADRLLHARLGHSAKVSSLSDLEYRVWTTYVLAADDFGVMRADAVAFQAAHDGLSGRPAKAVQRCVERLVQVELVAAFTHQGSRYLYQSDWQDFQRVRYPLRTMHPLPAGAQVSARTRHLWSVHPGGTRVPALPKASGGTAAHAAGNAPADSGTGPAGVPQDSRKAPAGVREDSGTGSEVLPSHARACQTANGLRLTANGSEESGGAGEGEPPAEVAVRAAALVERYRTEWYPRHRGVAYAPTRAVEASDADAAVRLCAAYGDGELARLAERFLTAEGDRFLAGRTRTVSMLLSRAPALAEQLAGRPDGGARSTEPREAYDAVVERAQR